MGKTDKYSSVSSGPKKWEKANRKSDLKQRKDECKI